MPERKVTKEFPAQKEANIVKKKKIKPERPPARPTVQNVIAAKEMERMTREGMEIRE